MSTWQAMTADERAEVQATIAAAYIGADGQIRPNADAEAEFMAWIRDQAARGVWWAQSLLDEWADAGGRAFCRAMWKRADAFEPRVGKKVKQRRLHRGAIRRNAEGKAQWAQPSLLDFRRADLIDAINSDLAQIAELTFNVGMLRALLALVDRTETDLVSDALALGGYADLDAFFAAESA